MGSLRTPVGPLPSSIYWRRRAVVLLLIAVVVLLVVWALRSTGGGGGNEDPAGRDDSAGGPAESITPGPTPSESLIDERPGGREDPSDEEEPGSGGSDGEDGSDGSGGGPGGAGGEDAPGAGSGEAGGDAGGGGLDPAGVPACGEGALTLSLRSDANVYAPGEEPELRLTVQNEEDAACRVDFGHRALRITLADAEDEPVWSSDDCPSGAAGAPRVIPAGESATHTVTWDRAPSADGCGGPEAGPGTYLAEARLSGHQEVRTSFRLDED
ncbi:hypothetical protein RM780_18385 [Streptomyces sp. DSM 44917]|uniref:Intracellular proteinase inhibitor BsuPI domain-containing protein n=1 Tax=Streptomyces boetiae TaxID=3075541 RepID=A0ABU2LBF4_9ACTN|nr:hypothetical protein [Streptomyces sp. DSM 44917]MDT0308914.1 hypothetical protein [Streptomyces sp. DSM 44917]